MCKNAAFFDCNMLLTTTESGGYELEIKNIIARFRLNAPARPVSLKSLKLT